MADDKKVTILRLKRRRTEDPFQALFIKAKKSKGSASWSQDEDFVFRLVKSSLHNTNLDATKLMEDVQSIEDDKKFGPQKKKSYDPYRLLSKVVQSSVVDPQRRNATQSDEEKEILMEVYDVAKEELIQGFETDAVSCSAVKPSADTQEILCNSMKLIREKLTISEDSDIQDSDYVYDLYYGQEKHFCDSQSLLYIQSLDQDILCDIESDEPDLPIIDDEDDSNDENNWRNDYPDEDDFFTSGDGECSENDNHSGTDSSGQEEINHSGFQRTELHPQWYSYENEYLFEAYDPQCSDEGD